MWPLSRGQDVALDDSALWRRLALPPLQGGYRWFLLVEFAAPDRVNPRPTASGIWLLREDGRRRIRHLGQDPART